jgi:hypothetical protein
MKPVEKIGFAFLLFAFGWGQGINNYADFEAFQYELSRFGYPSRIIPLNTHQFAYVEWWEKGMGRPFPGYYVTAMDRNYEEKWFKPIADLKTATPRFLDIIRLHETFGVILDYPKEKAKQGTYVSFFRLNGDNLGSDLLLSFPTKKNITSRWRTDENQKRLLWYGYTQEGNRLQLFATVYEGNRFVWQRELPPFSTSVPMEIPDANVTETHDLLCLYTPIYTFDKAHKDTLAKPILQLYNYRTKEVLWDTIYTIPRLLFPRILILDRTTAILTGIAEGRSATTSLVNRGQENWYGLFYRKYDLSRRLAILIDTIFSFPQRVKDSLTEAELLFHASEWYLDAYHANDPNLYFVLEEAFQRQKVEGNVFFRRHLLLFAIDEKADTLKWGNVIRKNQRYLGNDHLLSYTPAFSSIFFHLIYLTEPGAGGVIKLLSINKETGDYVEKVLASNQNSDFYFFPKRSAQITERAVILMGIGQPNKNAYRLIQVILPP